MGKLDSKVALVTGASRGLGREIAIAFAAEGAKVAVNYNASASRTTTAVEQIRASGGVADVFQADVSDPVAVDAMVRAIEAQFGGIDVNTQIQAGWNFRKGQGEKSLYPLAFSENDNR